MTLAMDGRSELLRAAWLSALLVCTGCGDDSGDGADRDAATRDDAGGMDAYVPDPPQPDAASGNSAVDPVADASQPVPDGSVTDGATPVEMAMSLHDTGLYAGQGTDTLAPGVREFAPRSPLWSDGAVKRRFLQLPPGAQIDNSDPDAWVFPVGTKAWKEFSDAGTRIETRLLEKRADGWFMMAYAWNADGTEARAVIDGVANALGTTLDIPPAIVCVDCHGGGSDGLLGATAVQLGYPGAPLSLADMDAAGLLDTQPAQNAHVIPGDEDAQFALGYLDANCSHCHNPRSPNYGMAGEMNLRLTTDALATAEGTAAYTTTVGVDLHDALDGYAKRIVAGQPGMSALVARMAADKTEDHAMPPLATEVVDAAALQRIEAWISAL